MSYARKCKAPPYDVAMIRLDVMHWIFHWVAVGTRLALHLRRITLAPLLALSGWAGTAGTAQAADFAGWPSALKDIAQRQRIAPQQVAMWVAPVDGGPGRAFAVGERIDDSLTLVAVEADRVIVSSGTRRSEIPAPARPDPAILTAAPAR